ncbi:acyltransferase family protein [Streptomyces marokkonensis]|uniref:acyltransferase family protein n=1 Tax=Streptomyces marokkonensis TaxID=324855 RepID=UPI00142EE4E3|nr:acyltransferase [Streptomyces marokkonensis]
MTSSAQRPGSPPASVLPPEGGPAPRLHSLTGLRWIAALAVFLSHVSTLLPIPHTDAVFAMGSSGVTFFFVLSGFVLTWTWTSGDRTGPFYGRRFARIWPLLVIGVTVPLLLQLPDAPDAQSNTLILMAVSAVLLYQAWVPNWILGGTSPVTWSLACEAFFYAVFPFVAPYALRRSLRWLGWAAVTLVLVGWGIKLWLWEAYPPTPRPSFTGMDGLIFGTYSPIARVWEFLLGVVAAAAVRKGWRSPLGVRGATGLLLAGLVALWLLRDETWRLYVVFDALGQVTAPLYALLVVAVAQRDMGGSSSWLARGPMVALGEWSYAFYLLHFTVLFEIASRVSDRHSIVEFYMMPAGASWTNLWWVLLALGLAILVSALLHQFYERPAELWLRARIGRRVPASPGRTGPHADDRRRAAGAAPAKE